MADPTNDENQTIIGRMQQRRGLKQDLPQPLRPGEFGFTVDSQQLYIGADPEQAPAYNKTSVYESTTGAVETANAIMNNQMVYFTFPFKKYAKGEPSGASNSFNWLPSTIRLTGVDTDPVFSNAVTSTNNVKSIMTNSTFRATDLYVKRNSKLQEGNNSATYTTLASEDYIFDQANSDGTTSHNLVFRSTPQPSEEITVSYYDKDAIIKLLSNRNGGGGGNQDGFYAGTAFPSFYTKYEIPAWDQIDTDLIQISDTSGSGYIGLEFKHVAPRAMSSTISNPTSLTGLCDLVLVTPGNAVSDRLPSGANIEQTANILEIPVTDTTEFSLTSPDNIISLSQSTTGAGDNWLTSNSWIISSIDSANSTVSVDIADSGFTHFPVTEVIVGSSASDITITSPLAQGIIAAGTGTNGHFLKMITGNVTIDDMFFRVKVYPNNGTKINGEIWAEDCGHYKEITTFMSPFESDAVAQEIQSNLTNFVNWGYGKIQSGNLIPASGNVVQVYSKFSNYNNENGYANITIAGSSNAALISNTVKDINQALKSKLLTQNELWSSSTTNTFFIEADSPVQANVTLSHYPNLGNITANEFYLDDTLIFDLSSVTNLNDLVALVNSQNDWPLMQLVPGETDSQGNPNKIMITLNPAVTSAYTTFEIVPDECGTAELLGLAPGKYDQSNTFKAKLEDWFADLLIQPDCPIINTVAVGETYSKDPATIAQIEKYTLPFDETFQELTFASREEALAFNEVVNQLYFQRSTSDIRGLVNIKSNLEIELKTGLTIGDKTVTYVDLNGAEQAIPQGPSTLSPTEISPSQWTDVIGAVFNTSDYDTYVLEYTIREAEFESATGDGYQKVGTLFISGRQDFSLGIGDVVFQDNSSEMTDVNMQQYTTSSDGDAVPALHLRVISDGVNVRLQAFNRMPQILTMRYLVRRWNSLG